MVALSFVESVWSSHREYLSEEVGEQGEGEEPDSNGDEDPTTPILHPCCLRLDSLHHLVLGPGHPEGSGEDQADENEGSGHEGEQRGFEASHGERVAGQTGQDRPGSTKPGEHIAKTEDCEPRSRPLPSETRLAPEERLGEAAHSMH